MTSQLKSSRTKNNGEKFVINTPIGHLEIETNANQLVHIELNCEKPLKQPMSEFSQEVVKQIDCYFNNPQFQFDLEINPQGTEYQSKVWNELTKIPVGKILTYGELASQIDSGARAVGNACRNNPIPLIVPCHRIVSASGLGGFSGKLHGQLINIKQTLLQHEKAILL